MQHPKWLLIPDRKHFFYFSCLFNFIVYWIIGVLIFYYRFPDLVVFGDFFITYKPAVSTFINNPSMLYFASDSETVRSLPFSIFYYIPFYQIPVPLEIQFFIGSLVQVAWTAGVCIILSKILDLKKIQEIQENAILVNKYIILSIYLLIPWQWIEYWIQSSDSITAFFLVLGIYLYLKDKKDWAFFSWSFGSSFKIFPLFLLLCIIYEKSITNIIRRCFFIILGLLPNIILFICIPNLLPSYIFQNINPIFLRSFATGSFTRDIIFIFSTSAVTTTIIVAAILLPFHILFILNEHKKALTIIDQFMIMFFVGMAILPEFYIGHNLVFLGIYILWLSTNNPNINNLIKLLPLFPVIVIIIWLIFPNLSIFYFLPLILVDISILTKNARGALIPLVPAEKGAAI